MATHSIILAWGIPMDRGAWWATVHGVTKSQPSTPGVVGTTVWPGDCGRRPAPDNWDTCLLVDSALGGHCRQRGGAVSFCAPEGNTEGPGTASSEPLLPC